jgi:hypothetical protein
MRRPRRRCGNIRRLVSLRIHWRLGRLCSSHRISRSRSADTHWSSSDKGEGEGVFAADIDVTMLEESGSGIAAWVGFAAGSPTWLVWLSANASLITDWRVLPHCVWPIIVPRTVKWNAAGEPPGRDAPTGRGGFWNGIPATASVTDKGHFGIPACNLLSLDIVAVCFSRLAQVSAS